MNQFCNNVLFKSLPTRKQLRDAIATIVRDVQLSEDLTDDEFAESINVSAGTIRNARNKVADLGALAIAAIGRRFGEEKLQPYADLMDAQLMPRQTSGSDPVPALGTCIASLAVARSLKEKRDALPVMRIARDVLNNCITETERAA